MQQSKRSLIWEEESGPTWVASAAAGENFPNAAEQRPKSSPSETRPVDLEGLLDNGGLQACLACAHPELYTQKDFSRALGLVIVTIAAVLAPATNYISLGVAAALDWLIYHFSREVVVCYVCDANHRGFGKEPRHPRFDIEIAERLKYGTKAVMGKPMRPGGTAGAPEPEH